MANEPIDRERLATLDNVLRRTFWAGTRHGAGYEMFDAIPKWETEIQFRAFMDDMAGRTWTPEQWREARRAAEAKVQIQQAETDAGLY